MTSLQCLSLQLLEFFYLLSQIVIYRFLGRQINSLNNSYLFPYCGILLKYSNVLDIFQINITSPKYIPHLCPSAPNYGQRVQ